MTSVLPTKGANTFPLKSKMDNNPKIASEPTKDESRSFLSFSRENLSISHSDLEQGFNKIRPRVRRDTILGLIAIFLALSCVALEIWKIQGVVDNAREIEMLKREVESMKHRLLEEDLLNELKAFEEQMYAEEENEDDDDDVDSDEYVYDDEDEDEADSQEYPGDYRTAPYTTLNSETDDTTSLNRKGDIDDVLASLHKTESDLGKEFEERVRENRENIERELLVDEEELEKPEMEDSDDPESPPIKRKRSTDREQPLGYNPSGVPIYSRSYFLRSSRNNSTRNSASPRLSLYDSLMTREKTTTEKTSEESSIHHAVITSWDKHPPKKYYAQSRPETSHITPPPSYVSRVQNSRQRNGHRSGGLQDHGPQALTRQETAMNQNGRDMSHIVKEQGTSGPQRRGMTRRHLRSQRQIVAAHYGADSSLFASEDEHVGNGKARHHQGVFKAWKASNWVNDLGMTRHFTLSGDGRLTVQEPGLYLIYAQVHYLDEHDENGFQVLVNGQSILQCMVYSPGREHKSRSCFSAQAALLQSGDHLLLKDVGLDRYTLFQHDKSFFGLVKLGDTRSARIQSQN